MNIAKIEAAVILILGMFLAGFLVGRASMQRPAKESGAAPAVRIAPGNLILERKPETPPAAMVPELPKGATITRAASFTVEPVQALPGPLRINVLELDTPEGPRLQVQTPDGKILQGVEYSRPGHSAQLGPWGAGLGAMVGPQGPQPVGVMTWTRGRWTVGSFGGIRSGPNWPGIGAFVVVRF